LYNDKKGDYSMNIGDRIKQKRLANNLTLEEIGKTLGLNKSTISKYESGLISIPSDKIEKLAKILNTTPAYLMGWEENSKELKSVEDLDFSGINRIAAHFEGDEFSEDDLNEIQNFINYVKQKNKNKEK
jgi:transcriptional regulator with XRE-family HTH domain